MASQNPEVCLDTTTTYTLTVTDANGCAATDMVKVTVSTCEAPPTSEHVKQVCQFISKESPEKLYDVMTVSNYAYLAYEPGLYIADVGDKNNPQIVGEYLTPDETRAVFVLDNYAYVAAYTSGLRIIDVGNPSAPFEVSFLERFVVNESNELNEERGDRVLFCNWSNGILE